MTKILKAAFAAGWIVLLAIFLARIREFLIYWPVAEVGFIQAPLVFLSTVADSWFGYTAGVYLILWLIGKWWMKYVWPWPTAPK
jgi:hypothetical protein